MAAALTATMLSGCGQSADEEPEASGAATSASAPGNAEAGDRAAAALDDAIAELVRLDTGHYRHVITVRDEVGSGSVESPENNPVSKVGIRFSGGTGFRPGAPP